MERIQVKDIRVGDVIDFGADVYGQPMQCRITKRDSYAVQPEDYFSKRPGRLYILVTEDYYFDELAGTQKFGVVSLVPRRKRK